MAQGLPKDDGKLFIAILLARSVLKAFYIHILQYVLSSWLTCEYASRVTFTLMASVKRRPSQRIATRNSISGLYSEPARYINRLAISPHHHCASLAL